MTDFEGDVERLLPLVESASDSLKKIDDGDKSYMAEAMFNLSVIKDLTELLIDDLQPKMTKPAAKKAKAKAEKKTAKVRAVSGKKPVKKATR